ncbi:tRNA dihydrouridine(20/20a) synthase DusA [Alteromonadaceae bacterium M269]|nr:tRNA dihydrouridine(20/20a) synthase DusA [Alteromonadaceae bacterium M269]
MSISKDLNAYRKISVAPMLDWTDRHCRYFLRLITKHTLLYTEMVTTGAIIYGKGDYLSFSDAEHPVALQLGGSDPAAMAECAVIAKDKGYDEVNMNVGCPSDRVQNGRFGACLMAEPETVAQCVRAMQDAVDIPVTVKCRIGVDDMDEYEDLSRFVEVVTDAGCETLIVHARKAWLKGLSPKQNREIPPLLYDRVYELKQQFPHLHISINGGVKTLDEAKLHMEQVDGVMIGREAYANPSILSGVDARFYGEEDKVFDREQVVKDMLPYIQSHIDNGGRVWHVARHMLGLFQGQPGGRIWRRFLSQQGAAYQTNPQLLIDALDAMQSAIFSKEEYLQNKAANSDLSA